MKGWQALAINPSFGMVTTKKWYTSVGQTELKSQICSRYPLLQKLCILSHVFVKQIKAMEIDKPALC